MIIQSLLASRTTIPLIAPFKTALRTATEVESIQVEIQLSNGITGRGSAAPTPMITGETIEGIFATLNGPIKNNLIGKDVSHFRDVLGCIQASCVGNPSAKAAADIALHDAYSKWLCVPLSAFLGGKKELNTCMTIGIDSPEQMAEDAVKAVQDGFSVLKVKVGNSPDKDIERMIAIKSAIPENIRLRIDANQGWTPKQAVDLINQMDQLVQGIEFVEQPVKASDWSGLKFVKENVSLPIMADESIFTAEDALKLVSGGYVDLLNIKLMKAGGISEAWKIATIAEANGIACMAGSMMESCQSVAAAAHFAAAHPNVIYFDFDAPLWLACEPEGLRYAGSKIEIFDTPGIGTENEEHVNSLRN